MLLLDFITSASLVVTGALLVVTMFASMISCRPGLLAVPTAPGPVTSDERVNRECSAARQAPPPSSGRDIPGVAKEHYRRNERNNAVADWPRKQTIRLHCNLLDVLT